MLRVNVRTQNKKSGRERIVRRQTELGGHSAGSSRTARLDPLALPVRFTANDAVADEAGAACGAASRTRDPAPCRARHAHRAQRAGQGIPRRFDPADPRAGRTSRRASRSISSTSIRRSRSSFIPPRTPTTSLPNGSCGRACSACRRWSPAATASSARRSRSSVRCASRRRRSAAAAVRRSASAARDFSRAAVPA